MTSRERVFPLNETASMLEDGNQLHALNCNDSVSAGIVPLCSMEAFAFNPACKKTE